MEDQERRSGSERVYLADEEVTHLVVDVQHSGAAEGEQVERLGHVQRSKLGVRGVDHLQRRCARNP
jgi:hypothetical protein